MTRSSSTLAFCVRCGAYLASVAATTTLCALFVLGHPVRASQPPFLELVAPRLSTQIPGDSVASAEGALATVVNPAALEAQREADLTYLRTVQGNHTKDDAFFLSWRGGGLGLEYFGTDVDGRRVSVRRTTLSGGSHIGGGLYWGTARSWYASDDDDVDALSSWDVGLLWRQEHLSVGATARRLSRPRFRGERLERTLDFGVALRPFEDQLTVHGAIRKPDDESFKTAWKKRRYQLGLSVEPIRGFRIAANAYGDAQFDVQAVISAGTFSIGTHQRLDHGDRVGTVTILNLHEGESANALRRRRYVIITTPDEWRTAYWRARRDKHVEGVVIKLDGERLALAEWQEMRDQLGALKRRGVSAAAYIHKTGTGGYWLASIGEMIILDPIGEVRLIGLHAGTRFYRRAMDRFGIDGYFERAGEYKSGTEPYTRTAPSEPVQRNRDTLLDDLYNQIVDDVAHGRGMSDAEVRRTIDEGPYLGEAAFDAGIVDIIATPTEAEKILQEQFRGHRLITAGEYASLNPRRTSWSTTDSALAIVRVNGIMVDGKSARDPFTRTRLVGSGTIGDAIRAAAADDKVKAIVLDIDSGGGLVTASEAMWRAVNTARKSKPVVARIGGVGASGGYYVATAADEVIAQPASITGSIGVYTGHVSLRRLAEDIGIDYHADERGTNAGFYRAMTQLSPNQRKILRDQAQTLYELFLHRVGEGRGMTTDEVDGIAQGRVWTGRQAYELGLVDSLGGLAEAIDRAKTLAGVPRHRLLRIEILPVPTFLERVMGRLLGFVPGLGRASLPEVVADGLVPTLAGDRHFAWAPWTVRD